MERYIAPVMQAVLDLPVATYCCQQCDGQGEREQHQDQNQRILTGSKAPSGQCRCVVWRQTAAIGANGAVEAVELQDGGNQLGKGQARQFKTEQAQPHAATNGIACASQANRVVLSRP